MNRTDFDQSLTQLISAAELIAAGVPQDQRMAVFEALSFFRLRKNRIGATTDTSNDELFKDSAIAALTMAGRKEYLAALALLDQAPVRNLTIRNKGPGPETDAARHYAMRRVLGNVVSHRKIDTLSD
ncbi:hypothetical protein BHUM_06004 [Candidatus Burkholderia humilis]|nr:hypothetical protein BHUM_06004 [Candidatus Burkholderia humilis]